MLYTHYVCHIIQLTPYTLHKLYTPHKLLYTTNTMYIKHLICNSSACNHNIYTTQDIYTTRSCIRNMHYTHYKHYTIRNIKCTLDMLYIPHQPAHIIQYNLYIHQPTLHWPTCTTVYTLHCVH